MAELKNYMWFYFTDSESNKEDATDNAEQAPVEQAKSLKCDEWVCFTRSLTLRRMFDVAEIANITVHMKIPYPLFSFIMKET